MESEATPAADVHLAPRRVGAVLGEARTAAGLELADIARDTRVPVRHLRAIEADDHSALPALPYAIGFVKSFARAVHLDAEAVATQFRSETSKTAHVPATASIEVLDERRMPPRGLLVLSIVAVLAIVAAVVAYSAGMFTPSHSAVVPTAEAPALPPPPAAVTPADAAAPVAAAPASAAAPAPVIAPGPVSITATEDAWIKIYDKATRTSVKVGNLKAGERFDVPAEPAGLMLWTGRAGALKVSVGGRELPPLGGPAQTVKDVSLAPADLIARAAAAAAPASAPAAAPAQ